MRNETDVVLVFKLNKSENKTKSLNFFTKYSVSIIVYLFKT